MALRFSSLTRNIVATLLPLAVAVSLTPRDASACGTMPTPYVTIDAITAIGADPNMPVDSALLITGKGWYPDGGGVAGASFTSLSLAQHLQVQVTEESTGEPVEGSIVAWYDKGAVWRPIHALSPNTSYEAQISLDAFQPPPPEGAEGILSRTIWFTSDEQGVAPLQLVGSVSLTAHTAEVEYCPPQSMLDCGGCLEHKSKLGRVLQIRVPRIKGGLPSLGHAMRAVVTNDSSIAEGTVNLGAFELVMHADEIMPLTVPLPIESAAYGVCVTLEVTDANGTRVGTSKTCLADTEVWADFDPGAAGNTGAPMDMSNDVIAVEVNRCSMSHQPARVSGLLASLAIAAGTALRRRRRIA